MNISVDIPETYKVLWNDDYLYYVFYGGRGAGKTENVALSLVLMSLERKIRVLCIRESQASIAESVKATLEKWIAHLKLDHLFHITTGGISNVVGSDFIFAGMKAHNAINVKSISNVAVTWVEEAETFSKRSWDVLVPSVIRVPNPKIIITFNPYNADDCLYNEFVVKTPPMKSFVKLVNYDSNPFFKGSTLEAQMENDRDRLPESEFRHKWEGQLVTYSDESIFRDAITKPLNELFDYQVYERIVVACDPATTNKDYSNEYGVVVCGIRDSGLIDIIDDLSGNFTPLDFVHTVNAAATKYNTSEVVVEVNNGGDFIKASILQVNPYLRVHEVRAGADKVMRANPVASLMTLGQVRFLQTLPKLERQMRLMTNKGYLGSRGESPDRLDAAVWAVYELANLRDRDSIWTLLQSKFFDRPIEYLEQAYLYREDLCYHYYNGVKFYSLRFNLYKLLDDYRVELLESFESDDLILDKASMNFLNYCPATETLFSVNAELQDWTQFKGSFDDLVQKTIPKLKTQKAFFTLDGRIKALRLQCMEFNFESDQKFEYLQCLCELIEAEL